MRTGVTVAMGMLLISLSPVQSEAVSVRDIVELTRAGLSDDVIVALIEVDATKFDLDSRQLLDLKAAGVSDTVLVAMLRSGRSPAPPSQVPEPAVDTRAQPATGAVSEPESPRSWPPAVVTLPGFVAVPHVARKAGRKRELGVEVPAAAAVPTLPHFALFPIGSRSSRPAVAPSPPTYWGFGGQRRPGSWDSRPTRDVAHDRTAR